MSLITMELFIGYMYGITKKLICTFVWKILYHLGDLDVDERILLKWIVRK
jgi:hypothetical protein